MRYCGSKGAEKLINLGKNAAKNKIALGFDNDTQTPVLNSCVGVGITCNWSLCNSLSAWRQDFMPR